MKCHAALLIVLLGVWPLVATGAETLAKPTDKRQPIDATPAQIANWVRELDADEFALREAATENLIRSGKAAVTPLQAADLARQNLEVITRGMYVLQELALSDDRPTEDAARVVLEQIAEQDNAAAARRAQATLSTLNEVRQSRAVQELQGLGVVVSITSSQIGPVLVHEVPTIEIGDNFQGEASDLKRLKFLQDVELVQLTGDRVNDEVVRHVSAMPGVTYLTIKRAKVTDAALENVAKLPKLQHLSIMYSPITNNAISSLVAAKTLTDVRIYGTEMTRAGADKLVAAMANTKIDYRHGAFLGIGCQASPRGCEVTLVHPNSAAAKAGLQPGDIVVKFAGDAVADFEGLTAQIAKFKAGDKVTFDVIRGGGPEKIEVTLGAWE